MSKLLKRYVLIKVVSLVLIWTLGLPATTNAQSNTLYQTAVLNEAELARAPVERLKSHLEKGNWNRVKGPFANKPKCENFCGKLNMLDNDGVIVAGCFRKNFAKQEIIDVVPLAVGLFPAYEVKLKMKFRATPADELIAKFRTGYDILSKQYFIDDVEFIGEVIGLDCGDIGPPIPPLPPPGGIPFESPCAQNSSSGFTYIKLRTRKSVTAPVTEASILGESSVQNNVTLAEVDNSVIFRQIPFEPFGFNHTGTQNLLVDMQIENPLYTVCRLVFSHNFCTGTLSIVQFITVPQIIVDLITSLKTVHPGYVLSKSDASDPNVNVPNPFSKEIDDADGVFEVPNVSGNFVSHPSGFFLDRAARTVVILTDANERLRYGLKSTHYRFVDPVSLTAIGKYVYVLDKNYGNTTVVMFRLGLNSSGELLFILAGTTDFGLDLTGAADLAGTEAAGVNILYITNPSTKSLIRILVDKNGGGQKGGADGPRVLTKAINSSGEVFSVGSLERLESSLQNTSTGRNTIVGLVGNTEIVTFSHDGLASSDDLEFISKYSFPIGTGLRNIGYNIGNKSFYVSDYFKHKVHTLSVEGEYLGTGGKAGQGESDNQLYYPNVISSNTFQSNTKEMVVINKWGETTGMKKFAPMADIGFLEVIEKAPVTPAGFDDNSLNLIFSLTDGTDIDQVTLELNGTLIGTRDGTNTTFLPISYSNNFLVSNNFSTTVFPSVAGQLQYGWNTYTVTLFAHVVVASQTLDYTRTKEVQFYYIPSSITDSYFTVDNVQSASLFHNDSDDPFVIYKNVFAPGGDTPTGVHLVIQNGTTRFLKGCVLTVNKPTDLIVDNELMEFKCGSNLRLIMKASGNIKKELTNSTFRGNFESDIMVTCMGEATGSKNPSTSKLEFINCTFDQYQGVALDMFEGRATLVSTSFLSTQDGSRSATGIFVSPTAKIDVLGGTYANNDIAIDAELGVLNIGTSLTNYAGTSITPTIFSNNKIGIHASETNSTILKSEFSGNDAGIMHVSGKLDIAQMSKNAFLNNNQAIIFSDILVADKGQNNFEDNLTDITYIMPLPTSQSVPITFDVECNMWLHGSSSVPIFGVVSDPSPYVPSSGLVTFDYLPQAKKNQKGNVICSPGSGNQLKGIIDSIVPTLYHKNLHEVNDFIVKGENVEFVSAVANMLDDQNLSKVSAGYYSLASDTVLCYKEAMIKNSLYSLLLINRNEDFVSKYVSEYYTDLFYTESNSLAAKKSHFERVTEDRLGFLRFFLNSNNSSSTYQDPIHELAVLPVSGRFYPNPVTTEATLEFTILDEGNYSLDIYNIMGQKMFVGVPRRYYAPGTHKTGFGVGDMVPGLYIGYLVDPAENVAYDWKFVIGKSK